MDVKEGLKFSEPGNFAANTFFFPQDCSTSGTFVLAFFFLQFYFIIFLMYLHSSLVVQQKGYLLCLSGAGRIILVFQLQGLLLFLCYRKVFSYFFFSY